MGSPSVVSESQRRKLLRSSLLEHSQPKPLRSPELDFILPSPSMFLLQLCSLNLTQLPPQPYWLRWASKDLLTWRFGGDTSCLTTFRVELSISGPHGQFKVIAGFRSTWLTELFYQSPGFFVQSGWYRVRAVDMANRKGPPSHPIHYNTLSQEQFRK